MKAHELFEEPQDNHIYPQELWNEMREALQFHAEQLQSKAQGDTAHSLGGNLMQNSSGAVALEKNYRQHSTYGGTTVWNLALKVGTNIQGGRGTALEAAKAAFKAVVDVIIEATEEFDGVTITVNQPDFVRVKIDMREFAVAYDYGSNFCWAAIRVAI